MTWLSGRVGRAQAAAEPAGTLCLAVAEGSWRLLLCEPGVAPLATGWSGEPGEPPVPPLELLRRAVRTVTAGQREQIGRVRVLVDDPALVLVDARFARLRLADPPSVRAAGAQELGCADALYAAQPFGEADADGMPAACAFLSAELARAYIGALDTLAVKLVELAPAPLLRLAAVPPDGPFVALQVAMTTTRAVVADPDTGGLIGRVLPLGTASFTGALAAAMSLPPRAAADGLARRNCLPPPLVTRPLLTATEQALAPLLGDLKRELVATLEHARFQRCLDVPAVLRIGGADPVRGLAEWCAGSLGLAPEPETDVIAAWEAADGPAASFLEHAPAGLLTLAKASYHFTGGRFVPTNPGPARRTRRPSRRRELPKLDRQRLLGARPWAAPAAASLATVAALWWGLSDASAARSEGIRAFTEVLTGDTALRTALVRRLAAPPAMRPGAPSVTHTLAALAHAAPPGLHLDRLQAAEAAVAPRDGRLLLEGRADGSDGIGLVNTFIHRLQGEAGLAGGLPTVDLLGVTSDGEATRFQIAVTPAPPSRS